MMPKVSVVMPIRNREHLLPIALASYKSQTWERKELVIIDDSDTDFVWPLIKDWPDVIHVRLSEPLSIGLKRNIGAEVATGDFLANFDSDDFSSSDRISSQMDNLAYFKKAVIGYSAFNLWNLEKKQAHRYYMNGYVCGASLLYSREFWRRNPFPDQNVNEDELYTIHNRDARVGVCGYGKLVVLIHQENISTRKQVESHPQFFPRVPASELPPDFFDALKVLSPTAVNE